MSPETRSFDVFDTVLTRLVGRPGSLFLLLGHRMAAAGHWPGSAQRFAAARVAAEHQGRQVREPLEVTLHDIYEQLGFAQALSPAALAACEAAELALEGELLRAVPAGQRLVQAARAEGHRVVFISDTYFDAATVRRWLVERGVAEAGDELRVSSEAGATKASGQLFGQLQLAGAGRAGWRHVGDHASSDVAVPRALGIDAALFGDCALNAQEIRLEAQAAATDGLSSLLAGAARWVRLSQPAEGADRAVLRELAAGVAGPVLWAFVCWVLLTARREGLRRIWFTARDGQVMLRMARRIAPRLGIDIEMGYLYGGRQVVHLAALQRFDEASLKWMTGGAGVVSTAALLERVGLVPADVQDALLRHGLPEHGPIGWGRARAVDALFRDPQVQAAVLAVAARRHEDMHAYFGACGLVDGEPCAIVDIGWRGSVLRSMFELIGPEHAARHRFLYFGLLGRPADLPQARMSAYCFDASRTPALGTAHEVPSLTGVMEIFCQADHPQVLHVERRGDTHVPRLRAAAAPTPTLWDVPYFQQCLEAFADAVPAELAPDAGADLRPLCEQLLRTLMATPTPDEARVLGSVPFVDDQSGAIAQPFARPFRLADCRATLHDGVLPQQAIAWWEQGAWALTPRPVQLALRAARKPAVRRVVNTLRSGWRQVVRRPAAKHPA